MTGEAVEYLRQASEAGPREVADILDGAYRPPRAMLEALGFLSRQKRSRIIQSEQQLLSRILESTQRETVGADPRAEPSSKTRAVASELAEMRAAQQRSAVQAKLQAIEAEHERYKKFKVGGSKRDDAELKALVDCRCFIAKAEMLAGSPHRRRVHGSAGADRTPSGRRGRVR